MLHNRPFNQAQTLDHVRFRSHYKGMGELTDLQPNDPMLQNVSDGTVYGNAGGNYNVPTQSQQMLVNAGIPQGVVTTLFSSTGLLLVGGAVLLFAWLDVSAGRR